MTDEYRDGAGAALTAGARVRVYGYDEATDERDAYHGVVESISDLDVADGDYGVPQAVWPKVKVRYDDGTTDEFTAHTTATGPWDSYGAPYECADLEVI